MKSHETLKYAEVKPEQIDQAREVDLLAYLLSNESGVLNRKAPITAIMSMTAWFMWRARITGTGTAVAERSMPWITSWKIRGAALWMLWSGWQAAAPYCFSLYSFRQPGTAETGGEKAFPPPWVKRCATLLFLISAEVHSDIIRRCMHSWAYSMSPAITTRRFALLVGMILVRPICLRPRIAGDLKRTSAAVISGLASAIRRIAGQPPGGFEARLTPSHATLQKLEAGNECGYRAFLGGTSPVALVAFLGATGDHPRCPLFGQ